MQSALSVHYREAMLPGPLQSSGYQTVMFIGSTGSGKTSLVRQLVGTDGSEQFPAVSSSKTTVADTEILLAPGGYYAVATFRDEAAVRLAVEECLEAALEALRSGRDLSAARRALTEHRDQRFRLRYLLGPHEGSSTESRYSSGNSAWMDGLLGTLGQLAEANDVEDAFAELEPLADKVLGWLSERAGRLDVGKLQRDDRGWPKVWHLATDSRSELFSVLTLLTGNDSRLFGQLLTPLVNGLRLRAPLHPRWATEIPYLMLLDTEGLGHSIQTANALPTATVDAFDRVDSIVVVDNAKQPLQGGTVAALRQIVESGHWRKVKLCFTHVDLLEGPNLRTVLAKRDFLRACVDQVTAELGRQLGEDQRRELQRHLDDHMFFCSGLHLPFSGEVGDDAVAQLGALLGELRTDAAPLSLASARPVYEPGALDDAVAAAVSQFCEAWLRDARHAVEGSGPQARRSWFGSLTRRLQRRASEETDGFRPGAELHRGVLASVRGVIGEPTGWVGGIPGPLQPLVLYDLFARTASRRILALCTAWLEDGAETSWSDPRVAQMKDPATAAAELEELLEQRLGLGRRDGFVSEAINVVVATAEELGFRIAPACHGALTTVADRLPEPQFERAELRAHLQEAERVR